jgi:ferric-dicitrate binding protein FerR (iron transport regulator)
MDRQQAKALVEKYNKGLATAEEKALLENWYAKKSEELFLKDDEIDFNAIEAELRNRTFEYAGLSENAEPVKRRTLWPRIAAAAAILLVIGTSLFFYTNTLRHPDAGQDPALASNDIAPGKFGATLTLANGKQILLSEAKTGKLAKQSGATITKNADGQLVYVISSEGSDTESSSAQAGRPLSAVEMTNTLTTAKGETYQVRLPDGTSIWLNAASTLKYPASFDAHKNRRVELSGEAYFEVAKDKAHPFIVATDKQEVEVLGTHFNINSYADEPNTKTTLLEGSVRVSLDGRHPNIPRHPELVSGSRTNQGITLKPGQQSILTSPNLLNVATVDGNDIIAWKEGKFKCKSETLESLMRKVARWYNVDVVYEGLEVKSQTFSGTLSRFDNVSKLLKRIELTGEASFKIEGKKIIVN